ncbi:MAG: hypothetical protein KDK36_02080 [Leptospiraceae bacterium]|nr:hypothetical protein [Leptospiraceae bacterium]
MRKLIQFLLLLLVLQGCKKESPKKLQDIVNNPKIPDEVIFIEVAKKIFKNQFKELKFESKDNKKVVYIDYGGNSALTFRQSTDYVKEHMKITAKYALKYFQILKNRKLETLVLSIVKPLYVKEEEINKEVIEEFEIFRVRIEFEELEKIPEWEKIDTEDPNFEDVYMEKIIQKWKVELNEFKRIELK